MSSLGEVDDAPEFSVVIPSRDRPNQLKDCLAALTRLQTPKDQYEVIVVDDGSREPYDAILDALSGGMEIRCVRLKGGGPGQARNAGAAIARGRFIALTDDDCAPAPDWLAQLGGVLRKQPDALAGGRTVNAIPGSLCSEASQVLISYLYDYYSTGKHENRFFASCNFALSTELYRQSSGFDPRFRLAGGEDRDFCARWSASGRPMVYVGDAVVNHSHGLTLTGFLRQHFSYGRGAWHFHKAREERGSGPFRIEPLPFLTGMLAYPFKAPARRWPLAVSALIGTSVVMNALGYFREQWGQRNHDQTNSLLAK
ncbi:MAG TPA: glycosyltransferase [Bryobacteraceae bacterium]|nr:glycosyltransferase [Bryobacteraceae bacterium]HPT28488.1 glycosyltransferase [Bryobacteraceae bacterium]